VEEEIITRNPVGVIRIPAPRKSKGRVWTVDEACPFLESARHDRYPLYAAYVLILVLGLRKGEALGLTWDRVDLDKGELYVGEQLQRGQGPAHPPAGKDRIIRSAPASARTMRHGTETPLRAPGSRP
jgi:integrase